MVVTPLGGVFHALTFPGILVSRALQRWLAELSDVPVSHFGVDESVSDLSELSEMDDAERAALVTPLEPGEPAPDGTRREQLVDYAGIEDYQALFVVALGPFLVGTAAAIGLYIVAFPLQFVWDVLFLVVAWLGISLAAQAFPNADARDALWERSMEEGGALALVARPMCWFALMADLFRFFWFDAIYALLLYGIVSDLVQAFLVTTPS